MCRDTSAGPSLRPDCPPCHRLQGPPALRPHPSPWKHIPPASPVTDDQYMFILCPFGIRLWGPKLGPNFSQGVWQADGRRGCETRASLTQTEGRLGPLGPMNQLGRGHTLSPGDRADLAGAHAPWTAWAPGPTLVCSPVTPPGCLNPLAQAWDGPHSPRIPAPSTQCETGRAH